MCLSPPTAWEPDHSQSRISCRGCWRIGRSIWDRPTDSCSHERLEGQYQAKLTTYKGVQHSLAAVFEHKGEVGF